MMNGQQLLVLACCVLCLGPVNWLHADEPAKPVDYLTEIKPLLTQRCGSCHGAETQKSGFRVDSAKSLIQGGDTGEAVIPGKPADSFLMHAILGTNGATRIARWPCTLATKAILRRAHTGP